MINTIEKNILIVDDEAQILSSLRRAFLGEYNILLAGNAEEALSILKGTEIHLILSDVRMPGMDGINLLKLVRSLYPNIHRVLMTGYTDQKDLVNAMRESLAITCVFKPWNNNELFDLINSIFAMESRMKDKKMQKIMNDIKDLPAVDNVYRYIMDYFDSEKSMNEIAQVIEQDQALTAQILHIANSAYYGAKTGSVSRAITYLGVDIVKEIILTNSVFSLFKNIDNTLVLLLQLHVNLCNKLVKYIYRAIVRQKLSPVFEVAGLLHDIGIVVLMRYFPAERDANSDSSLKNELNCENITIENNGDIITHMEAGGILLNRWGLPNALSEVAMYHHSPTENGIIEKTLVCAVHIADYYSWNILDKKRAEQYVLFDEAFQYIGTSKQFCDGIFLEKKFVELLMEGEAGNI